MKKIIALLGFFFLTFNFTFAQHCWNDFDFDFDYDFFADSAVYHPFTEVKYGYFNSFLNSFSGKFNDNGFVSLALGHELLQNLEDSILIKTKRNSFFLSFASTKIASKTLSPSPVKPNIELWQGGVNRMEGYGYRLGGKGTMLLFTSEYSFVWNRLSIVEPDIRTFLPIDRKGLERFNNAIRFGTENSAAIILKFSNHLSLNANYNFGVIFPRYLIWKHLGSFAIEMIGNQLIEDFVDDVYEFSPSATPLLNFILKNAFSYIFFNLKKDNAFYPFNSENPFYYKSFNAGFTIVF